VVVGGGLILGLSRLEWCAVVLACAAVWSAEALNTALELLADATTQEMHPLIGQAKDVAAGAVLVTAIGAAVVGLLVFGPHLLVRTR
jgi:diacylglycerol kinase (ATP)